MRAPAHPGYSGSKGYKMVFIWYVLVFNSVSLVLYSCCRTTAMCKLSNSHFVLNTPVGQPTGRWNRIAIKTTVLWHLVPDNPDELVPETNKIYRPTRYIGFSRPKTSRLLVDKITHPSHIDYNMWTTEAEISWFVHLRG